MNCNASRRLLRKAGKKKIADLLSLKVSLLFNIKLKEVIKMKERKVCILLDMELIIKKEQTKKYKKPQVQHKEGCHSIFQAFFLSLCI